MDEMSPADAVTASRAIRACDRPCCADPGPGGAAAASDETTVSEADWALFLAEAEAEAGAEEIDDGDVESGDPAPHEFAQDAQTRVAQAIAALWGSMADAIAAAEADPRVWVPMHPDQDPGFRERDLAARGAAMDLALRLGLPALTVRELAGVAERARRRLPRLWGAFADGLVSPQHLRAALEASNGLDEDSVRAFESQAIPLVELHLTPSRFRARARTIAARIDRAALVRRRRDAVARRGVWVEYGDDGMAWLTAFLPSEKAQAALQHLSDSADALARAEDETRTLDQLRADLAADLLLSRGTPSEVRTVVGVTVPVLTLLGKSDQPGSLDGVVPIDAETARAWCGEATSFYRILTDPIRSTLADVDRRVYRPPADLQRYVRLRDQTCTNPSCSRSASRADLDHVVPRERGGPTSGANLAALSRGCHHIKHDTLWEVTGTDGRMTWTSPIGGSWRTPPPIPLPNALPEPHAHAEPNAPPRPNPPPRLTAPPRPTAVAESPPF